MKLKYWIKSDMDLNLGWAKTPSENDDITKIHLHNQKSGVAWMHVLNAYKGPSQNDGDIATKPNKGVVEGYEMMKMQMIWDNLVGMD